MSEPVTCRLCAEEIAAEAKICKHCKAAVTPYVPCPNCSEYMPAAAKRCNRCTVYRGWWHRFTSVSAVTLAFLTALFGVLATALPAINNFFNRHSDTSVAFLTADDTAITISATNTGRRAAVIRSCTLLFPREAAIAPAELEMLRVEAASGANIISAGESTVVHYTTRGLRRLTANTSVPAGALVTVEIVLQESNKEKTHRQSISVDRLSEFIQNNA